MDVIVHKTLKGIQLQNDSDQFFAGNNTVQQLGFTHAYFFGQRQLPYWSENTPEK